MGSMSHMRQESPGFSRGEEVKAVGIIVGFIGAFLRDSLLFVRIIFISLVNGLIGVLLVMCVSDLIDNYYEQRSTAPPTIREQISKVLELGRHRLRFF